MSSRENTNYIGETDTTQVTESTSYCEKIEILSVDLLDQNRDLVAELREFARSLKLEFGWHYLLDIIWTLTQLGAVERKRIMDAGAGTGVMQWWLAENGAQVISVDRVSRANLPLRFRNRYDVQGLRPDDLNSPGLFIMTYNQENSESASRSTVKKLVSQGHYLFEMMQYLSRNFFKGSDKKMSRGRVSIYNQNLAHLIDIADDSLDAVLAISALEHNTKDGLKMVARELLRVLKPGGVLLATLCAARDHDWWHVPSSGWCYTRNSLEGIFQFGEDTPSNYDQYDLLFNQLKNCDDLRDNLAEFYFKSGDNGMPWGKWHPQYQPVGVCKVKGKKE
jgi:SAM-dependent methyltransferase